MRSFLVVVGLVLACADRPVPNNADRVDAAGERDARNDISDGPIDARAGGSDGPIDATVDRPRDASVDAAPDAAPDAGTYCSPNRDAAVCPCITRTGSRSVAYQIDPAHTGQQPNDQLALPLCERWRYDAGANPSYVLVADGRVFVGSSAMGSGGLPHVTALDELTGAPLWTVAITPATYGWVGIAYDNGRVFALNFDNRLRAIDAATGGLLWEVSLIGQYDFTAAPIAVGGTVYVGGGGNGGTFYAVDESTGVLRWTHLVDGDRGAPAAGANAVYVSYSCNQAYAFAQTTGTQLWHYSPPCSGGGGKTVALYGNRVYTRDYDGNLILDATSGALLGMYSTTYIPAFSGTTMLTTLNGVLSAQPIGGGPAIWTYGNGPVITAPIVVGPHVVFGTAGSVVVISLADGTERSSVSISGIRAPDEQNVDQLSGLVAADGMLFVPAGTSVVAY
jgi:outer membrane protein assembly factor BamB